MVVVDIDTRPLIPAARDLRVLTEQLVGVLERNDKHDIMSVFNEFVIAADGFVTQFQGVTG